jgi:hypothetical protein
MSLNIHTDQKKEGYWAPKTGKQRTHHTSVSTPTDRISLNSVVHTELYAHALAIGLSDRVIEVEVDMQHTLFGTVFYTRDLGGRVPIRVHIAMYDAKLGELVRVTCGNPTIHQKGYGVLNVHFVGTHNSLPVVWDKRFVALYVEFGQVMKGGIYKDFQEWVCRSGSLSTRTPLCSLCYRKSRGGKRPGLDTVPSGLPVASCVAPLGWAFAFGTMAGHGFKLVNVEAVPFVPLFKKCVTAGGIIGSVLKYSETFRAVRLAEGTRSNILSAVYMCATDVVPEADPRENVWAVWFREEMGVLCPNSFNTRKYNADSGPLACLVNENDPDVSEVLSGPDYDLVGALCATNLDDVADHWDKFAGPVVPFTPAPVVTLPTNLSDYRRDEVRV